MDLGDSNLEIICVTIIILVAILCITAIVTTVKTNSKD